VTTGVGRAQLQAAARPRRARRAFAGILIAVALAACSSTANKVNDGRVESLVPQGGSRPFTLFTPSSYRAGSAMPLVVLLHGLASSGTTIEQYFNLQPLAASKGFLYVHPDGTKHPAGDQFWNATDACCGFGSTVDDLGYLTSVIDSVEAVRNVDRSRVYVMGHSNGGFMSYRMACDLADRVAAIASVAGATWADPSKCHPSQPVSVLQVHGTNDQGVKYGGGTLPEAVAPYPGATTTVTTWGRYDGCSGGLQETGDRFDLDGIVEGDETTAATVEGCPHGIGVELWTVEGGGHIPQITFSDGSQPMPERIIDWLLEHPKP
jgi:polyhydroxybutyrate depolymerase